MMNELLEKISTLLATWPWLKTVVFGLLGVVGGLVLAKVLSSMTQNALKRRVSAQQTMIATRLVRYSLTVLTAVMALHFFGVDLSVLAGAAGVLTVAIGFASQTSASNLISGLFLMGEQPFVVGDVIQIGQTTGEVISIDLLSIRLRTYDNLMVRIPNETILKSEITNVTHFPIRRIDIFLGLPFECDLSEAETLMEAVAHKNPRCLEEPAPLFACLGYGESQVNVRFSAWTAKENFLSVRNQLYADLKAALSEGGIEFPYPHRVVIQPNTTQKG